MKGNSPAIAGHPGPLTKMGIEIECKFINGYNRIDCTSYPKQKTSGNQSRRLVINWNDNLKTSSIILSHTERFIYYYYYFFKVHTATQGHGGLVGSHRPWRACESI